MKIKTLMAVLFLSAGATSVMAQSDSICIPNSSVSHEAVKAGQGCLCAVEDCVGNLSYTSLLYI